MATAAHKTPERSIDEAMEDLTLAQRKKNTDHLYPGVSTSNLRV